jgi:hypothetical protein
MSKYNADLLRILDEKSLSPGQAAPSTLEV